MNSKIKNIIILIAVAIVLVLIYIFFIKKGPEEATLTSSTGEPLSENIETQSPDDTAEINKDFLTVLLSVKSIKLDDAILSDEAFLFLKDSTITLIQVGDEGRPNPFAPLGSDGNSSTPPPDPTSTPNSTPVSGQGTNTPPPAENTGQGSQPSGVGIN